MSRPAFLLPRLPLRLPRLPSSRNHLCTATALPHRVPSIQPSNATAGTLYIVSTPIGNINDLTFRAASILRTASIIAAEDTRRAGLLLSSTAVGGRTNNQRLLSCHEHNVRARVPDLLRSLSAGESVALVSDAGTPCVSDPGAQLVKAAVRAGVDVVPIPGACAALAALVASALPLREFTFVGFLPRSGAERKVALERVANTDATIVLYEAPHRLTATLGALHLTCENREICLAREVTKKWEQFLRFSTVAEACQWFEEEGVEPRGEFTIVLGPVQKSETTRDDLRAHSNAEVDLAKLTSALVNEGVAVSTVARSVAAVAGVPKKLVYSYASECKKALQDRAGGDAT